MKLSNVAIVALIVAIGMGAPCIGLEQDKHAGPPVLFTAALQDAPGKQLVVVGLELKPKGKQAAMPHRHPGSVYVYVTRGTARLGLEGQPVHEVHTGESFFEPPGALHTIAESASDTESAAAIAVMIVPAGAPLVTVDPHK